MPTYHENRLTLSGLSREEFAAWVWRCRNLSKEERAHKQWQLTYPEQPIGWYLRGRGSIWVPHPQEVRPCCQVMAPPNLKYGWAWQKHCRSLRHIGMLFNVDERDIRAIIQAQGYIKARKRCSCGKFISQDNYACKSCLNAVESPA